MRRARPTSSKAADGRPAAEARLPPAVIGLGLVSLFTDASSEAIFPLLPAFLATLGATNATIGLIEGAAELVANTLKYATGRLADRRARLKPLVLVGYGISTVARPLVAWALGPWQVLAVRLLDRVGKGVRSSPRDALIAAATDPSMRARAYGFHRAMDHAGAGVGTLLGAGILWLLGATTTSTATAAQMRTVFQWAAVPGVFAMTALALTREPPRPAPAAPPPSGDSPRLPPALRRALWPIALFAFANATDAFILVKAARLGASPILTPLLWLALHVIKASTATPACSGRSSERPRSSRRARSRRAEMEPEVPPHRITTSCPRSSRHCATHSLSVEDSTSTFASSRPPSTSLNRPRSVRIRRSTTSPAPVMMHSWLSLLCTSIPIWAMAGLHLRHLTAVVVGLRLTTSVAAGRFIHLDLW